MNRHPSKWARRGTGLVLLALLLAPTTARASVQFKPSGKLEIHYINVGQGGCTLIVGPNGTRILYDFGKKSGDIDIVPYLRDTVRLAPADGLDYAIVSHRDTDHYMGYKAVVERGYSVKVANLDCGSPKVSPTIRSNWLNPAARTPAGPVQPIRVGDRIALGDGAQVLVVAANGKVFGDAVPVKIKDENDRSIALYITYGKLQYILDGDLGSGPEACTDHQTDQVDVQTRVATSLLRQSLMDPLLGVDVLHIAHHGSESSTSAAYYNLVRPEVGLISVGRNQGTFRHPRVDVVDGVLLPGHGRAACVTAPPLAALYQTEDGVDGTSATGRTSLRGITLGDIVLTTDGRNGYTITGNYRVHGWEKKPSPMPKGPFEAKFKFDEPN